MAAVKEACAVEMNGPMSFFELPAEKQEELLAALRRLYDDFEEAAAGPPAASGSCAGCGRCCTGPPLYMTCTDLEFAYAMQEAGCQRLGHQAHFEEASPDRRHAFASWTCPFYSHADGCTVYASRPLACRVFGRYARERIPWDHCGYRDVARLYADPRSIPLYGAYLELLSRYPAHRGYVFPDGLPYTRPAVELLLGVMLPWAPMENVRIDLT